MKSTKRLQSQRQKREWRVRNQIRATAKRLRLSVFRSNKHIYAQIIDDAQGRSVAAASTAETALLGTGSNGGNKQAATLVGKAIAERAIALGIKEVVFDRGQYRYHGRLAALADAAREAGLDF